MPEPWYGPILHTLLSALVGATVAGYFTYRQLHVQRRLAFRERQLTEFYAPLCGIRAQIEAKSEIQNSVSNAADAAWREIVRQHDGHVPDHDRRFAEFKKIIEYNNEQLRTEQIPKYREMLTLFTERYHLAAKDTRPFYREFLSFVEIWNRYLVDSLPAEVLEKIEHKEANVKSFYDHLERKMQDLQEEIARG